MAATPTPPTSAADPIPAIADGFTLLMIVSLAAVVLITLAITAAVIHRARARNRPEDPAHPPTPDPWAEAGRRVQPIDPDPDLPHDDLGDLPDPNDETLGWQ